ncbi:MAG TPA: oligosaccharide flippase family protein [Ignavibacteriaceae bacterium]|nr:oligosaccharide flippase family protein [Ignavibacteriaceae bacterium]
MKSNSSKTFQPGFLKGVFQKGINYFYINLVDRLVAFLSFLLLARAFDLHLYGKISTVFAFSSILVTVFDLGLPIYAQREAAKKENLSKTVSEIFSVKVVSIILYVIFFPLIAVSFYSDIPFGIILIIGAVSLLQNLSGLLSYFYFGKENSWLVLKSSIVSKLILLVAVTFSYFFLRDIYIFLSGYVLSYIFLTIVYLRNLDKYDIKTAEVKFLPGSLKITLVTVLPIGISGIFNLVYDKIDIVILSAFLDFDKVAQYSVAYTVYRVALITFTVILFPAFNQFSRLADNYKVNTRLLMKYVLTTVLISVVVTVIFVFVVSGLIPVFFGDKYDAASLILVPLSFSIILWGLNALSGVYLNGLGKFKNVMVATLTGMIFNIVSNIVLIPVYGVIGSVYATIATEGLILLTEVIFILNYYSGQRKMNAAGTDN